MDSLLDLIPFYRFGFSLQKDLNKDNIYYLIALENDPGCDDTPKSNIDGLCHELSHRNIQHKILPSGNIRIFCGEIFATLIRS